VNVRSRVLVTACVATVTIVGVIAFGLVGSGGVEAAPARQAIVRDTLCVPVQVAVWANAPRIHVRCASAVGGGIQYFALSTSDSALAARVLSVMTTAQVAGRTLDITFDPSDLSGASIGCLTTDCRLIEAISFGR
jgi:hypothetical protein